jgi:hypothetical protein
MLRYIEEQMQKDGGEVERAAGEALRARRAVGGPQSGAGPYLSQAPAARSVPIVAIRPCAGAYEADDDGLYVTPEHLKVHLCVASPGAWQCDRARAYLCWWQGRVQMSQSAELEDANRWLAGIQEVKLWGRFLPPSGMDLDMGMWHSACGMWRVVCGMWHVTCGMQMHMQRICHTHAHVVCVHPRRPMNAACRTFRSNYFLCAYAEAAIFQVSLSTEEKMKTIEETELAKRKMMAAKMVVAPGKEKGWKVTIPGNFNANFHQHR